MTTKELLIRRLSLLSEEDIASLLNAANHMKEKNTLAAKPDCSYCVSHTVIRYGHKCRKQRFFCKSCGKTFVSTTHTIMSNSHFPAEAWREAIHDTVHGNAIDITAKKIGCSHQAVFDMRHKVLMALQQLPEINGVCLVEVSEFDETFVLNCYKGKEMDDSIPRRPRRHGAKAEKEASLMRMCASAPASSAKGRPLPPQSPGQRNCLAYSRVILRTVPSPLFDGLRSYQALPGIADCIVRVCNVPGAEDTCFYNLNTVNGFHSFIKQRYVFYRGVASKYINRYNALFSTAYRNSEGIIRRLISAVLTVTGTDYYHSNRAVRVTGLLDI